jgi:predicted DCC family thiol-disulfide oxidoreductase YuxK
MTETQKNAPEQIIFFDGVCHLCNGFVDFVIQNETPTKSSFVFTPLQGETARHYLPEQDIKALDSVLLWKNGKILRQSEAVIEILRNLRAPWNILGLMSSYLPRFLRDGIYQWVARHRYHWFGVRETCRLPTAHEQDQLWP